MTSLPAIVFLSTVERGVSSLADITNAPRSTAVEACRQSALKMLKNHPNVRRAIVADQDGDPANIIVSFGLRNLGTKEVLIPKAEFTEARLVEMIEECAARDDVAIGFPQLSRLDH